MQMSVVHSAMHAGLEVRPHNPYATRTRMIYQPLAVITRISHFFPEYFLVDIMKDGVEIFHFSKSGDKWPIITRLVDF